jgi:hypothetical protein
VLIALFGRESRGRDLRELEVQPYDQLQHGVSSRAAMRL